MDFVISKNLLYFCKKIKNMKPTDIIFDSIRHEAKEATKNTPDMRYSVDMALYWYNHEQYKECFQKIQEANKGYCPSILVIC